MKFPLIQHLTILKKKKIFEGSLGTLSPETKDPIAVTVFVKSDNITICKNAASFRKV